MTYENTNTNTADFNYDDASVAAAAATAAATAAAAAGVATPAGVTTIADIQKSVDAFVTKAETSFVPVTELATIKASIETFTKANTDMNATTKAEHTALLERFEKQEAQFKAVLPTNEPVKSMKVDFGEADWTVKASQEFFMYDDGTDADFTKAVDNPVSTPGAPVTATAIYTQLQNTNPFLRLGSVQAVGAGESTTLPNFGGITFVPKKVKGAKPTDTGELTSKLVIVTPHVAAAVLDEFAAGNLPDIDRSVVSFMAARAPVAQVINMVAAITTASTGGDPEINNIVKTGTANKLTATDGDGNQMLKTLLKMPAALSMEYNFGARFLVSRTVMAILQGATNSGYVFNPLTGIATIAGYPIEEMDGLTDGAANGNLNAIFGDMKRGIMTVTKKALTISRYEATTPGYLTYHGSLSFQGAVWDEDAITTLITGA